MKTHLVSQVILKEFTDSNGLLTLNYKDTNKPSEKKTTKDACYIEVETALIQRLEKYWNESVESDAKKTLRILKAGDILNYEKHINILKRLMALHYIRSSLIVDIFNELSAYQTNLVIEELMDQLSLEREKVEKLVEPRLPKILTKTLVQSLEELIEKVDNHISKFGIEVGVAPETESFMLSDSPAILLDKNGNLGPRQGVALLQASGFVMVMTPKHVVGLKSGKQGKNYRQLTADQVKEINKKQIKHSLSEYYSVDSLK